MTLKFEIIGDNLQMVKCLLTNGSSTLCRSRIDGEHERQHAHGKPDERRSFLRYQTHGNRRESCFDRFTPQDTRGFVSFAGNVTGKIFTVKITPGKDYIAQKESFLCCEEHVNLDIAFTQRIRAGFFGGAGFILQRMTVTVWCSFTAAGTSLN